MIMTGLLDQILGPVIQVNNVRFFKMFDFFPCHDLIEKACYFMLNENVFRSDKTAAFHGGAKKGKNAVVVKHEHTLEVFFLLYLLILKGFKKAV